MTDFKKLNKNSLKMLIKEYKADLERNLQFIKKQRISKMKKSELVELVEKLFSEESPNNVVDVQQQEEEKQEEE